MGTLHNEAVGKVYLREKTCKKQIILRVFHWFLCKNKRYFCWNLLIRQLQQDCKQIAAFGLQSAGLEGCVRLGRSLPRFTPPQFANLGIYYAKPLYELANRRKQPKR